LDRSTEIDRRFWEVRISSDESDNLDEEHPRKAEKLDELDDIEKGSDKVNRLRDRSQDDKLKNKTDFIKASPQA
jgi:hypothetical protein